MTNSTTVGREHGLDSAGIGATLGLTAEDCLVITGSRVLPFETISDDVDLFVLAGSQDTARRLAAGRNDERLAEQLANGYSISYVDFDGDELDVEAWPVEVVLAAVEAVGTRPWSIAALERDFTRVGGLETKVGTDLFHTLLLGRPLLGATRFQELRDSVPWQVYLMAKRDVCLVNVRDGVKGIGKSLRDGRADEAYLKLCWAADNLVDGMIFHHGHSINRWKWRLRYLDLLPPSIGDWYRDVRFPSTPMEAEQIAVRREFLAGTWRDHAGQRLAGSVDSVAAR